MICVGDLGKCYGGSRYKHDATAMNARYRGEYKRVVHANGVMLQHVTSRAVMTYERRSCTTQESMEADMTCKGTLREFLELQCQGHCWFTQRLSASVTGTPHVTESSCKAGFRLLQSTHGNFTANPSREIQRVQLATAQRTAGILSQTRRSRAKVES